MITPCVKPVTLTLIQVNLPVMFCDELKYCNAESFTVEPSPVNVATSNQDESDTVLSTVACMVMVPRKSSVKYATVCEVPLLE